MRNAADAEYAASMAAYMRDQFSFFGVKTPLRRRLQREVTKRYPTPDERVLRAVVDDCWSRRERELQYFGGEYVRAHVQTCSVEFLPTARHAITTKSWWDTVDVWAAAVVGHLVREYDSLVPEMERWIEDDDIWLARSALLHQLGYCADTDRERLFRFCLRRAGDREFFLRKAIGWALREYSKVAPDDVAAFVHEHEGELSGLSRREALKRIGGGPRERSRS